MSGASRLSRMNISGNRRAGKHQLASLTHEQLCSVIHELISQVIDLEHKVQSSSCYKYDRFTPRDPGINYHEF